MQQAIHSPNMLNASIFHTKDRTQETWYISVEFIDVQPHWNKSASLSLGLSVKKKQEYSEVYW